MHFTQSCLHSCLLWKLILCISVPLGSANGEDQVMLSKVFRLDSMVSRIRQELNFIDTTDKREPMENGFVPPLADRVSENSYINQRLNAMEQIIAELKKISDGTDIKERVNTLEAELEEMQRSLSARLKKNAEYQKRLEQSLLNTTSQMNELTRRLMKLEEPFRLAELKKHLSNRDLVDAQRVTDSINDAMKIMEVVKQEFIVKNDVDFIILFSADLNDLKLRLLMFEFIDSLIVCSDFDSLEDSEKYRYQNLETCNKLKLYQQLHKGLLLLPATPPKLRASALSLANKIRTHLTTTMFTQKIVDNLKSSYLARSQSFESHLILNNSAYIVSADDNGTSVLEFGFNVKDNLNCWFNVSVLLYDRKTVTKFLNNGIEGSSMVNLRPMSSNGSLLYFALQNRNYKDAVRQYELVRNNNYSVGTIIHNIYNDELDIDSLLTFISLVRAEKDERLKLYTAVYTAINKTDITSVCDLMKLVNKVDDKEIDNLKTSIYNLVRASAGGHTYLTDLMNIVKIDYCHIKFYSKFDHAILGDYRFYTVKRGNITLCYFQSGVSVSNYESWYTTFTNKFGAAPFVWPAFVLLLTKVCVTVPSSR